MPSVVVTALSTGLGALLGVLFMLITNRRHRALEYTRSEHFMDPPTNVRNASEDECTICWNTTYSNHRVQLECGHSFHKNCFDQRSRLQNLTNCPNCS